MLQSERAKKQKAQWELLRTYSLVEATHKARDLGWGQKKVQVKGFQIGINKFEYVIEPYEKDCGCSSLMKYDDYFTPPTEDENDG